MLEEFKTYYKKAKMMQELKFEGASWSESDINDELIYNVPIYDVVNRRYAAFSSLPEAIRYKEKDPKENGIYFKIIEDRMTHVNFIKMCYLFRLCGSGINYKPQLHGNTPFGTHGFGNFWIVEELRKGFTFYEDWLLTIPEKGFCDVKGYLLPMIKGGLRNFIIKDSRYLLSHLIDYIYGFDGTLGIKQVVDEGNKYLMQKGFKRQNFVLTAFAMDIAEYYPELVDRDSDVYVGTNAKKCLKLILPGMKTDDALRFLCKETGGHSKPYDMEDVACDFIRYIENFQSPEHIKMNNNIKYKNNVSK